MTLRAFRVVLLLVGIAFAAVLAVVVVATTSGDEEVDALSVRWFRVGAAPPREHDLAGVMSEVESSAARGPETGRH